MFLFGRYFLLCALVACVISVYVTMTVGHAPVVFNILLGALAGFTGNMLDASRRERQLQKQRDEILRSWRSNG